MIPKVIHYCWFGRNPKSDIILKCIDSWREKCPDWEIKEWNEDNFNIKEFPYAQEAYANKKWAFVSDVARLAIVYQHGGVYMDTDVELFASLSDLSENDAFFAFESERYIASGLGFGASAKNPIVKEMLDMYNGRHFMIRGKPDMKPCPAINTEAMKRLYPELHQGGKPQQIGKLRILSYGEYSSMAKHYGTATWVTSANAQKRAYQSTALKRWLRQEKNFNFIENHLGTRAMNLYTFFAYDLLENGPVYFIRRLIKR